MRRPSLAALKLSHRFRTVTTRIAPYAAAASAALILWHAARDASPPPMSAAAPLLYPADALTPVIPAARPSKDAVAAAQQASVASTIVVVGRNDTLAAIFRRMALDPADLAAIRQLPGIRQSLDFLKPGDAIKLTHSEGSVQELTRQVSETKTLHVVRDEAGFAAKVTDNPVETRVRTASATIDSSLFQAAESAHMSDTVALKLAGIFAWDIDFVLDIREGDRFKAVYEQVYQDGKYLRDGDILAAEFVNDGKVYRAVRYVDDSGAVGYYTPDGKPMRKAFLRAPVEFTRVSSVFNPHRLHPILNIIRGHMGTDYAAPIGTPVHAAGDGRVSFEGVRGGYGNAIVLSHANDVSTLYGHMSRFARGIHLGSRVQQGQVIGYVGMTGLATGPHLHYEYLKNGVHLDPQRVKLPGAEPLRADALSRFRAQTAPWLADLAAPQSPANDAQQAALQPSPAPALYPPADITAFLDAAASPLQTPYSAAGTEEEYLDEARTAFN
ncbi:MAG TPA: peptidoglycan DD-metalloendopeptidase family protein [Steroidobacteraceae bacterium]|nr:peptidoglycan DD-metalloendopeptidase family protein [Steroidobacteraceae bacterium]